jgi:hypothetical protein
MPTEPIQNTPYSNRLNILSELWLNYRNEEEFKDFFEYNDLGLPLAYAIDNAIVESSEIAERFVNETFDILLAGLDVEDNGYDSLDDLLTK